MLGVRVVEPARGAGLHQLLYPALERVVVIMALSTTNGDSRLSIYDCNSITLYNLHDRIS